MPATAMAARHCTSPPSRSSGARHQATLNALIAAGANMQLADREGRTPLQLAKSRGYAEMVKMLEAARAR